MLHKWLKKIVGIGLALVGAAMIGVAFFAYELHLDNNPAMGTNRTALAWLGAVVLLASAGFLSSAYWQRLFKSAEAQKWVHFMAWARKPYDWLTQVREETGAVPRRRGTTWFAAAGAAISIFVSLWYVTSGRFFSWTPSTVFFDRQANAFLAGQLSLLEKPPAALAEIPDPYVYTNRTGVTGYFWDASYYQGKYYYYWGPVPGLITAGIKLFNPQWLVQDQYLVILAIAGLAIVQAALFYWLQKRYFPKVPGWAILGLTLLGSLNTPVFWLVNHPIVHEVPISFGQFFLILGLYTAIRAADSDKHRPLLLALTGLVWGAAIGSRLDLMPGIAWMVLLAALYLINKTQNRPAAIAGLIALLLPLALWGAGLAWYNYARFGNILETGHRYQLTGGALPENYTDVVSVSYVLPNLYNLLARPFEIHWNEFPFFFTPWIRNTMWPRLLFFPRNLLYFYGEPIAGLFPSMPSLWIIVAAFIAMPLGSRHKKQLRPTLLARLKEQSFPAWLLWMVTGAILLNIAFLSIFIFSTMRYLADVTPLLTVLLALCLGWASAAFSSRPRLWRLLLALTAILIILSIFISLLTNFQNADWLFKTGNPPLYQAIEHLFTGK